MTFYVYYTYQFTLLYDILRVLYLFLITVLKWFTLLTIIIISPQTLYGPTNQVGNTKKKVFNSTLERANHNGNHN